MKKVSQNRFRMNGKRLIDLSIPGVFRQEKVSEKTTECSSCAPSRSKRHSRAVSAVSRVTISSSNHDTIASLSPWSSRGTSTISRYNSGRPRSSNRTSVISTPVPGLFREATGASTDLSLCLVGLTVWIFENNILQRLEANNHGFFHQSNCYLVYKSGQDGNCSLHVWSGSLSNQAECDAVKMCAKELDKTLGGASIMTLECERQETPYFLRHFQDGIIIVEGKFNQLLRSAVKYVKRLYRVQGRTYSSASCIECSVKAATVKDVLILDGYPRIYVWVGDEVDFVLRVKAIKLAKKIRTWQRHGKCHIIVIDQNNKQMSNAFLRKLDSDKPYEINSTEIMTAENMTNYKIHLYKVNGERVMYDMPFVAKRPLQQKYLTPSDSFLLDLGPSLPLYIWVGNSADMEQLGIALQCAENFKQHHNYPHTTPVCRIREGSETIDFKKVFTDWKDRILKSIQLVKSYHITNIGTALFSSNDHHKIAKLTERWSDDHFLVGNGTYEKWQVDGDILKYLPQEQNRIFYNCHCYIILYKEKILEEDQFIVYFWEGSKTSRDSQNQTQKLALSMNSVLGHKAVTIRIVDGKEPHHFLTTLQRIIIVYDIDLVPDNSKASDGDQINSIIHCNYISMFCVHELTSECVRIFQVPTVSTSLNSAAAYIVISEHLTILWYGKNSSACEREHSKHILAYFCPARLHDYDIIFEGGESAEFWSLVELIGNNPMNYPKQFPKTNLHGQSSTLSLCSRKQGNWSFIDIPDFSQEDLCDSDIFILDTHDQIKIWIGSSVLDNGHELLSDLLQIYIDSDPAGRKENDLQILFCNQVHEPSLFIKHFKNWDKYGYGGKNAYEAARKQLRQENASIDIDCQMIDTTYMHTAKISYKNLVKEEDLPANIDLSHKEYYLSDADFTRALKMTRTYFYRLPMWKQHQILKSSRIAPH